VIVDNPHLDALLGIPFAQKLISLEVHDEIQHLKEDNEAATRLRILEQYLLPVLTGKCETWSQVRTWQFHNRHIKWAREEILWAQHGQTALSAVNKFPALRDSPQLATKSAPFKFLTRALSLHDEAAEKKEDRLPGWKKLPTSSLVSSALETKDWARDKNVRAARSDMARIASQLGGKLVELRGGGVTFSVIPDDADVSSLSLPELMEVAGGHVIQCGPLNALCEKADVYQLWTQEYVAHLGRYLQQTADSWPGDTVILDVAAGDGLLAHFLRDFLTTREPLQEPVSRRSKKIRRWRRATRPRHQRQNSITVISTDDGSWRIQPRADVEQLRVEDTLQRYCSDNNRKQVIVLCSWMPMGQDWTALFREAGVHEYILVGEYDDGQCGHNWKTWGNESFLSDEVDDEEFEPPKESNQAKKCVLDKVPKPYEVDGYRRKDLDELSNYQFSRYDCRTSKSGRTISFRRAF
jgi:hypothetical protein